MHRSDEMQEVLKKVLSSMGSVFLYSTLHLDPGQARMLAEWLDVGQFNNP